MRLHIKIELIVKVYGEKKIIVTINIMEGKLKLGIRQIPRLATFSK